MFSPNPSSAGNPEGLCHRGRWDRHRRGEDQGDSSWHCFPPELWGLFRLLPARFQKLRWTSSSLTAIHVPVFQQMDKRDEAQTATIVLPRRLSANTEVRPCSSSRCSRASSSP